LKYYGETSTELASIDTAKLLINITLSTKGVKFMAMDISKFYIQNDLNNYQYIRFAMNMIPQYIIDGYNLTTIVHEDGYCYTEIRKVMCGLRKVGYIANIELTRVLGLEEYVPSKFTPRLFTHKTRNSFFACSW